MASISVGKAGFGCQRLFRGLGTGLTAMERSDAERVSPFDSMLVSPCRGRGHAVTFASSPAQVGATRRPPSQRLQPCLSRLEEAAQTLRLDRRRRAMRDSRQPRSGAGQPRELHHIGDFSRHECRRLVGHRGDTWLTASATSLATSRAPARVACPSTPPQQIPPRSASSTLLSTFAFLRSERSAPCARSGAGGLT